MGYKTTKLNWEIIVVVHFDVMNAFWRYRGTQQTKVAVEDLRTQTAALAHDVCRFQRFPLDLDGQLLRQQTQTHLLCLAKTAETTVRTNSGCVFAFCQWISFTPSLPSKPSHLPNFTRDQSSACSNSFNLFSLCPCTKQDYQIYSESAQWWSLSISVTN